MTAKEWVTQVFARWEQGDQTSFFDALAAEVQWTTIGSTSISGHSTSKAEVPAKTKAGLLRVVKRVEQQGEKTAPR